LAATLARFFSFHFSAGLDTVTAIAFYHALSFRSNLWSIYKVTKGAMMKQPIRIGILVLTLAGFLPSPAEPVELTCATLWNKISQIQKASFLIGFNEGVMAALAASDLPETAIKKILPSVWPGTNSAENVVAQMDVACRNADNRDETLVR
jgi:hypothetical protein